MRLIRLLSKNYRFQTPKEKISLKDRIAAIPVPHKKPANDNTELHWQFDRYVCQLKRLVINYCPNGRDSRGLRRFLDFEVSKFVKDNPGIAVYAYECPQQAPKLVATYMDGNEKITTVPNHEPKAIAEVFDRILTDSGRNWGTERLKKPWISMNPSIQGTWNPFLFKPPQDINPDNYVSNTSSETKST